MALRYINLSDLESLDRQKGKPGIYSILPGIKYIHGWDDLSDSAASANIRRASRYSDRDDQALKQDYLVKVDKPA